MDGTTQSTTCLEFGPETLQSANMQKLGIAINLTHKLVICLGCHSAIVLGKLFSHVQKPRYHEKKDFQKGQWLSFATQEFCDNLVDHHHLADPYLKQPTTIIPAIPGLTIPTEMTLCTHCGYGARQEITVKRHTLSICPEGKISKGHAQTFFPTSLRHYFAVNLPSGSNGNSNMRDPVSLFHN